VDDLAVRCAQRFVAVFGAEAGDLRTRAAGDARRVDELIIREIAQTQRRSERAALLDVLGEFCSSTLMASTN
jgi:hypothetical protein